MLNTELATTQQEAGSTGNQQAPQPTTPQPAPEGIYGDQTTAPKATRVAFEALQLPAQQSTNLLDLLFAPPIAKAPCPPETQVLFDHPDLIELFLENDPEKLSQSYTLLHSPELEKALRAYHNILLKICSAKYRIGLFRALTESVQQRDAGKLPNDKFEKEVCLLIGIKPPAPKPDDPDYQQKLSTGLDTRSISLFSKPPLENPAREQAKQYYLEVTSAKHSWILPNFLIPMMRQRKNGEQFLSDIWDGIRNSINITDEISQFIDATQDKAHDGFTLFAPALDRLIQEQMRTSQELIGSLNTFYDTTIPALGNRSLREVDTNVRQNAALIERAKVAYATAYNLATPVSWSRNLKPLMWNSTNINDKNSAGYTLLRYFIQEQKHVWVRQALDLGADLWDRGPDDSRPIDAWPSEKTVKANFIRNAIETKLVDQGCIQSQYMGFLEELAEVNGRLEFHIQDANSLSNISEDRLVSRLRSSPTAQPIAPASNTVQRNRHDIQTYIDYGFTNRATNILRGIFELPGSSDDIATYMLNAAQNQSFYQNANMFHAINALKNQGLPEELDKCRSWEGLDNRLQKIYTAIHQNLLSALKKHTRRRNAQNLRLVENEVEFFMLLFWVTIQSPNVWQLSNNLASLILKRYQTPSNSTLKKFYNPRSRFRKLLGIKPSGLEQVAIYLYKLTKLYLNIDAAETARIKSILENEKKIIEPMLASLYAMAQQLDEQDQQIAHLAQKIKKSNQKSEELETALNTEQAKAEELQRKNEELALQVDTSGDGVGALKTTLAHQDKQITELTNRLEQAQKDAENAARDAKTATQDSAAIYAQLSEQKETNKHLIAQSASQQETINALWQKMQELADKVANSEVPSQNNRKPPSSSSDERREPPSDPVDYRSTPITPGRNTASPNSPNTPQNPQPPQTAKKSLPGAK